MQPQLQRTLERQLLLQQQQEPEHLATSDSAIVQQQVGSAAGEVAPKVRPNPMVCAEEEQEEVEEPSSFPLHIL